MLFWQAGGLEHEASAGQTRHDKATLATHDCTTGTAFALRRA
jgi:hypothetical protein